MSIFSPALLAAVDQQMAESGQALDHLVGGARKMLAEGDDRNEVIVWFIQSQLAGISEGRITGSFVMRMLGLALVRLAEAGEPS